MNRTRSWKYSSSILRNGQPMRPNDSSPVSQSTLKDRHATGWLGSTRSRAFCASMHGIPLSPRFHDEFTNKRLGQPLELLAMAEVLTEAHLHVIDVNASKIENFLSARDQLLRNLTNESGLQSALSLANALSEARNSPDRLEKAVCDAFRSLGFDVTPLGKKR